MEEKTNDHLDKMNREQSIYNGNEPANPIENHTAYRGGLTKREYFAGLAMQGYCGGEYTGQSGMPTESIAEWSVEMADALLIQLRKNKNE